MGRQAISSLSQGGWGGATNTKGLQAVLLETERKGEERRCVDGEEASLVTPKSEGVRGRQGRVAKKGERA